MIRSALLIVGILASCSSPQKASINPQSGVITGTLDQNLLQVAGKPVATSADGVQTVALANQQVSQDPCDGNPGQPLNKALTSTGVVQLVPPMANLTPSLCSIHVNGIYKVELQNNFTLFEGGGANCATSPTYLIGDADPANGAWIAGGGNGGFIEGGAGATIYKATGPNRGICGKAANGNRINVSGTYNYK